MTNQSFLSDKLAGCRLQRANISCGLPTGKTGVRVAASLHLI
jgi:hypothetical protein